MKRTSSRFRWLYSILTAISHTREITVATAAPRTPMTGAPSFPKMRTQFRTRFINTAIHDAAMGAAVRPVSRRVEAYTMESV